MRKPQLVGPLLIVVAAVLWALDGITRRSLYHLPPVTIVFYEHLIGTLLILPFAIKILKGQNLTLRVWGIASILGLVSGLLGTLWITTALVKVNFIAFSVVFLIQKLQPLFTITSARLILKEKITAGYLKWAILALIAAFFVTFPNGQVNLASGNGTVVAALYSLGAAAVWGVGTTLSKLLLTSISDKAATLLRYLTSTVFAFGAVLLMGAMPSLSTVGVSEVSRLVFIALTTGLVAMFLYYRGLKVTEAKVSTILELAFPLLAVFVDMFLYKTFLAPTQYLAAGALMFVMYRVTRQQKESVPEAKVIAS